VQTCEGPARDEKRLVASDPHEYRPKMHRAPIARIPNARYIIQQRAKIGFVRFGSGSVRGPDLDNHCCSLVAYPLDPRHKQSGFQLGEDFWVVDFWRGDSWKSP